MSEGQASSQETLSSFFSRGTSQIALILPLDSQLDFSGLHSAEILISMASFRETYPCCPQESSQVGPLVVSQFDFARIFNGRDSCIQWEDGVKLVDIGALRSIFVLSSRTNGEGWWCHGRSEAIFW